MLKKLFSHSAIYGLVPQLPKLVSLFTLPIITPHLSKTDFGVYGVITAVVAAIAIFNTLGLNVTLTNYFFKSPTYYKIAWRQIYGFLMLWNIPYSILIALIIWCFIPKEALDNYIYIVLVNVLPIVLFGPTSILGNYYYQLRQKPFQIAIRGAVFGTIGILLTLYFIAYLKLGYMGWFWSAAITQILMQMSYWYPINNKLGLTPIFNFKWRFIKKQLKVGLPTVPHFYGAYMLNTSDRLIMKSLGLPTSDIGLYNAANTVSNVFNIAGIAAGKASAPMMMQGYKNKDELMVRKLTFVLQILFLWACFLSSIWLKEVFEYLLRNKELAGTYSIGIILIMGYSYRPMYLGANNRLFYYEKTKSLPKITLVAGVSTVVLNLIFIPIWGFQVAAYTTFIGLMYMGYSGFFLKQFKENCTLNYYPLQWIIMTLILTFLSYFIVEFNFFSKIIISVLVIILCLFFLFKINRSHAQQNQT